MTIGSLCSRVPGLTTTNPETARGRSGVLARPRILSLVGTGAGSAPDVIVIYRRSGPPNKSTCSLVAGKNQIQMFHMTALTGKIKTPKAFFRPAILFKAAHTSVVATQPIPARRVLAHPH